MACNKRYTAGIGTYTVGTQRSILLCLNLSFFFYRILTEYFSYLKDIKHKTS